MKIQQKRYSESFRLMVLEELRTGKWDSLNQAARAYNIRNCTIENWLERHGMQHLRRRILHVNTAEDVSEIARLKAEVKALKAQLFDAMLDQRIEHATLAQACRLLNTTPEDLKKNSGLKSSTAPSGTTPAGS